MAKSISICAECIPTLHTNAQLRVIEVEACDATRAAVDFVLACADAGIFERGGEIRMSFAVKEVT